MDKALFRSVLPYAVGLAIAVALFIYAGTIVYSSRPGQLGPETWPRLAILLLGGSCLFELSRRLIVGNKDATGFLEAFDREPDADLDPGQRRLGVHLDLHFERRGEGCGDPGVEDDQVADLDRMEELQPIHGGSDHWCSRVPVRGNRTGDVDQVHDGAAEDEPQRVRIIRQHHLHHLGGGRGRRLGDQKS